MHVTLAAGIAVTSLLGGIGVTATTFAPPAHADAVGPVTVVIDRLTPVVPRPDSRLRVEGRVVRVLDPNQAGDIDGAIMVAYRTDPGWVPLFPRIAALVVERGSLLSHSAVVAREMGIPSVVAVSGVMDALATGDRIRLDAVAGTIDVLEKAE